MCRATDAKGTGIISAVQDVPMHGMMGLSHASSDRAASHTPTCRVHSSAVHDRAIWVRCWLRTASVVAIAVEVLHALAVPAAVDLRPRLTERACTRQRPSKPKDSTRERRRWLQCCGTQGAGQGHRERCMTATQDEQPGASLQQGYANGWRQDGDGAQVAQHSSSAGVAPARQTPLQQLPAHAGCSGEPAIGAAGAESLPVRWSMQNSVYRTTSETCP